MKPTAADILIAIGKAHAGDVLLDQLAAAWSCRLYDPTGQWMAEGLGNTPAEAMAMAWVHRHCRGYWQGDVELGDVPFDVPAGWRFELF